jgi:hypothetical protein
MRARTLAGLLLLYGLVFAGPGLLGHELGHALGAVLVGGSVQEVGVAPGVVLYPELRRVPWTGLLGWVRTAGVTTDPARGVVRLSGCAATLLLALVAAGLLSGWRPTSRWIRHALVAGTLLCLDGLTYTFLPLLGLRHWIVLGGHEPEPLVGLDLLGWPRWIGVAVALAGGLACGLALGRYWRRERSYSGRTCGR